MTTKSTGHLLLCPKCHSAFTDKQVFVLQGHCNACGWKGPLGEMVAALYDASTAELQRELFIREFRDMVQKDAAVPICRFLMKHGLISPIRTGTPLEKSDQEKATQELARYLGSAAEAMYQSFVDTRKALEAEERQDELRAQQETQ